MINKPSLYPILVIPTITILIVPILAFIVSYFGITSCSLTTHYGQFEFCPSFIDAGACALSPTISKLLCPNICGWCEDYEPHKTGNDQSWNKIDRIHISNLTYEYFYENYKKPGIPLVIEGWLDSQTEMNQWNFTKLIEICGHRNISLIQRRAHVLSELKLKMIESKIFFLKTILDFYLYFRFQKTLSMLIEEANKPITLKQFIERIQNEKVNILKIDYRSPLDYLGSSYSVNDFPIQSLCPEFANEINIPSFGAIESLYFDNPEQDRRQFPNIFIEADQARAYPAHQHAYDLSHGFQLMLEGSKKVVMWPYEDKSNLYETKITTEDNDEIYMAEGIHHRFDLYPKMKLTNPLEGTVFKGDMIFVPMIGIHVFQSIGTSLGIRYMHHDKLSYQFGNQLIYKYKSKVVNEGYVNYLKQLKPFHLFEQQKQNKKQYQNDVVPRTINEMKKQILKNHEVFQSNTRRRAIPPREIRTVTSSR